MGFELAGTVLAGSRQQCIQRTIRSRTAEELCQQDEKGSASHSGRVVPRDSQEKQESRLPALLQCSGGFDPTRTLHQSESRLPSFGHAHAIAATRLCFLSGRILQPGDRAPGAAADLRAHGRSLTDTTTINWPAANLWL